MKRNLQNIIDLGLKKAHLAAEDQPNLLRLNGAIRGFAECESRQTALKIGSILEEAQLRYNRALHRQTSDISYWESRLNAIKYVFNRISTD